MADIPIVDLNSPTAAEELLDAASTYGFIFVKHEKLELSPQAVDSMFELASRFFKAPLLEKTECSINSNKSGKNHGWLGMGVETLDPAKQKRGDFKEAFNVGEFIDGKPQQPLPPTLSRQEADLGSFLSSCNQLCNRIMTLLGVALKIDDSAGGAEWFANHHRNLHGPSGSILRLLYYPALPDSKDLDTSEDIRAGAHSDYGSVTLLFRLPSQPGLEVQKRSGEFETVPVDPVPGQGSSVLPILVNIGDLLEYWTKGLLKSTVHRVVFPRQGDGPSGGEDRYSIAYFSHPDDETSLVEIPSQVLRERAANGQAKVYEDKETITARDHLNERLAATYGI